MTFPTVEAAIKAGSVFWRWQSRPRVQYCAKCGGYVRQTHWHPKADQVTPALPSIEVKP